MSLREKKPKAPYRDDHLLPPLSSSGRYAHPKFGKKCLVLDLDETLVHSSFKPVEKYDFIIPVEIEGTIYQVWQELTEVIVVRFTWPRDLVLMSL